MQRITRPRDPSAETHGTGVAAAVEDAAGEFALLSAVYEQRRGELVRHAAFLLHSPDQAEDVVHQAFANTLTALETGTTIRQPRGWLHRCVHNECMNLLRRETALPIDEALGLPGRETPEGAAELHDRCRAVTEALNLLPDHMRSAFLLAEVRGLTYREIAEEMGRSTASVRDLLARARQHIRDIAGHEGALIAGPLLRLGWLGERLGQAPRPGLRERLSLRVEAVQAWLSSLTEQGLHPVLQPAGALIAAILVAVPVIGLLVPGSGAGPPHGNTSGVPSATTRSAAQHLARRARPASSRAARARRLPFRSSAPSVAGDRGGTTRSRITSDSSAPGHKAASQASFQTDGRQGTRAGKQGRGAGGGGGGGYASKISEKILDELPPASKLPDWTPNQMPPPAKTAQVIRELAPPASKLRDLAPNEMPPTAKMVEVIRELAPPAEKLDKVPDQVVPDPKSIELASTKDSRPPLRPEKLASAKEREATPSPDASQRRTPGSDPPARR